MIGDRKRYILFEIISDKEVGVNSVEGAISKAFSKSFGELTGTKVSLIKDLYRDNMGLLVVNHKNVQKTKLMLALIKEIDNKRVIFTARRVFGTLRKVKGIFKEVI